MQITALESQKTKALELAKKVKEAASAKLKKGNNEKISLRKEYESQVASLREESLNLKSMIDSERRKLSQSHEAEILKLKSEFKVTLEEAVTTGNEDLKRAINDKCLADERVAELRKKLDDVIQNVNSSEKIQEDFEKEKLDAIEEVKFALETRSRSLKVEQVEALLET